MRDVETGVVELSRVLTALGRCAAIVGGGPKIGDSFELFLELLSKAQREDQRVPRIGERQARTDTGLRHLFSQHPKFENELQLDTYYVDFGGSFDEVWLRLSTIYDFMYFSADEANSIRDAFRHELAPAEGVHIPCTMAIRRLIAFRNTK